MTLDKLGDKPMTAAQALVRALEDAADSAPNFNIQTFWMSLYEYGYEIRPRPLNPVELAAQSDGSATTGPTTATDAHNDGCSCEPKGQAFHQRGCAQYDGSRDEG